MENMLYYPFMGCFFGKKAVIHSPERTSMEETPVQGRKAVWLIFLIFIAVIFFGYLGYNYVLPRAQMDVKVIYHEGVMGNMNVAISLSNSGTVALSHVNISISVNDETGREIVERKMFYSSMPSGGRRIIDLNFSGDQNLDHTISIVLSFSSKGKEYDRDWTFEEDGGYMNVAFERTVKDWFP